MLFATLLRVVGLTFLLFVTYWLARRATTAAASAALQRDAVEKGEGTANEENAAPIADTAPRASAGAQNEDTS